MIFHSIPFYALSGLNLYATVSQSLKKWRVSLFSIIIFLMHIVHALHLHIRDTKSNHKTVSSFGFLFVFCDLFVEANTSFPYSLNHFNLFVLFIGCGYSFTRNCTSLMTYLNVVVFNSFCLYFVLFCFVCVTIINARDSHILMLRLHLFHFIMQQCVLEVGFITNNSHFITRFFDV